MRATTGGARAPWILMLSTCLIVGCGEITLRPPLAGNTPEQRLAEAEKAQRNHPDEPAYRSGMLQERERSIRELLEQAEQTHADGKWEESVLLLQRVLALDTANARALAGLKGIQAERRHAILLEDAQGLMDKGDADGAQEKLRQVLIDNPGQPQAKELQARIEAGRNVQQHRIQKLTPSVDKPVTLEFRDANLRMVFEALTRATGINFVLDKDIRPDAKTTVFVKRATLESTIAVILATNQLQKKVLNENTLLVYPNTPQKIKEYQELMIRSFYLVNADVKQAANLLRTTLKAKDIYIDERLNLLVLRDTPENIRLAEKLVTLQDTAEPEVMLDVEVLEVTRNRLTEIGVKFPNQLTVGNLNAGGTFSALTVEALRHLNGNGLVVSPNPTLNFKKEDGAIDLLANPRIRVKNREKAKVQIGDRVPIVTSNTSATGAESETVQYLDVGLMLEVEPVVSLDNHVSIKVGMEVSSLGTQTKLANNSFVYQVGTRKANTLLRLRDGETQILAGLINDQDRRDASKVPGLGDIPLLGRLFSTHKDDRAKTEIVLAITPHVINNIQRPSVEVMELWSGTESGATSQPFMTVPQAGAAKPSDNEVITMQPAAQSEPVKPETLPPQSGEEPTEPAPPEQGEAVEEPAAEPPAGGDQ